MIMSESVRAVERVLDTVGEYVGENMLMSGPSTGMKMAVGASSGRPSGGSS